MNEKITKKLLKLSKKAIKKNEVPVAAVIVYKNKILTAYYNKREKKYNIMNHAEILCILKAAKKLKTWKLENCDLYVTLEPCSMCKTIIRESRIKNVFFYVEKLENKKEYNNTNYLKINDLKFENQIKNNMSFFFKNKR